MWFTKEKRYKKKVRLWQQREHRRHRDDQIKGRIVDVTPEGVPAGAKMPTTPPVPLWIDDDDNQSVPNLVANDDNSTDSSLIGFQQESEGEMKADHQNVVPVDKPSKRPLPEPPPS